jgi:hypothetical protein
VKETTTVKDQTGGGEEDSAARHSVTTTHTEKDAQEQAGNAADGTIVRVTNRPTEAGKFATTKETVTVKPQSAEVRWTDSDSKVRVSKWWRGQPVGYGEQAASGLKESNCTTHLDEAGREGGALSGIASYGDGGSDHWSRSTHWLECKKVRIQAKETSNGFKNYKCEIKYWVAEANFLLWGDADNFINTTKRLGNYAEYRGRPHKVTNRAGVSFWHVTLEFPPHEIGGWEEVI